MSDTATPATPTLADQIRAIDAIEVASSIVATGRRGAVGASTMEIIALAHLTAQLLTLADHVFEMMQTADALQAAHPGDRAGMRTIFKQQVSDVGFELEALGYPKLTPTISPSQENQDEVAEEN